MGVIDCPECGGEMVLRNSRYGKFYGCANYPDCDGKHGAHQATGEPLGIPADRATRRARIEAHDAFDLVWKTGKMSRRSAYRWMQKAMNLSRDEAHIGRFTKEQCQRLINAVRRRSA